MGVPQVDSDKIQTFVQSMYGSGIFEEKEMVVWENRLANIKSWEQCKLYFGTLYKQRQSFDADMKAHRAGYDSANSIINESKPPFSSVGSMAGSTTASS